MDEKADTVLYAARTQTVAKRDQMVIVDPDKVIFLDQRKDVFGKTVVDPLVALPCAILEPGEVDAIVEQRPKRRIGVTVVIFVEFALCEIDRRGRYAIVALKVEIALYFLTLLP